MSGRTDFVVCVTDDREAGIAVAGGADRIEIVRVPGRPQPPLDAIMQTVAGRVPMCAAPDVLGDTPPADGRPFVRAIEELAARGIGAIKLPATGEAAAALTAARVRFPLLQGVADVGLGETMPDLTGLGRLQEAGYRTVLFAPSARPAPRLIDVPGIDVLARCVGAAQRRGLRAALAGALEPPDIPRLLALSPDALAFRTSLCGNDRPDGAIDAARVAMIRDMIPVPTEDRAKSVAVGHSETDDGTRDMVFVRDYVVEAGIGAYRFEQRAPQRMRFNVEAKLRAIPDTVADMRDVFSYDVIIDAIGLATRKHVILVERIALDVARATLSDERVKRVRVRVEKLDILNGSVGVEIERER